MKTRVAVIYGGRSGEHEVSLRSAESIIKALDPDRYKVLHFLIAKDGRWRPRPIAPEPGANQEIDVVFPVLHGTFGEDGTIQGLLELADLPYVGPGVLASAASMDKEFTKRLCKERGLPVVEYHVFRRDEIHTVPAKLKGLPVFVKPANLGSSVGISKAKTEAELAAALELAAQFDSKILVERAINAREFECAVLGNDNPEASMPCEIMPSREFYDYEDKYILDQAKIEFPANLPSDKMAEMRELAVACFKATNCEGMARVDFLMDRENSQIYINEINTIPGFTSISMYPKMWEGSGVSYPQLLDRLIELAIERHRVKQATRYSR
jgi:D-alanine-D-alanine ligase